MNRLAKFAIVGALAVAAIASVPAIAQMMRGNGHGAMHAQMHGPNNGHDGMRGGGAMGGHDEMTMPGLRGENVTGEESDEMALLFRQFQTLTRTVENLPDGIRSVTSSSDPAVMDALVSHVTVMIGRVEAGDDPQVFIQSPTLDIFFERRAALRTEIEVTDAGIVVTQTSDDPELVQALHTHAAEVSDMAARGMEAVHERMMGNG
jgi:hypothetical protein